MDEPGAPRKQRPRKGFWARFSDQETGPQKVIVGLAGTVTALATTVGGVYAVTKVFSDDQSRATDPTTSATSTRQPSVEPSEGSTPPTSTPSLDVPLKPGQTLVTQGSKEADALVHALVDEPGKRATLNVVIMPTSGDQSPEYSINLWYNCQGLPPGDPPGADLCDRVFIAFDKAYPPGPVLLKHPARVELTGIWADAKPMGTGYGAEGLVIFPAPASF